MQAVILGPMFQETIKSKISQFKTKLSPDGSFFFDGIFLARCAVFVGQEFMHCPAAPSGGGSVLLGAKIVKKIGKRIHFFPHS
jgi:hypothetical protein